MKPTAGIAQPHPDTAWQDLINGNNRFITGQALHPGQDAARRAELRTAQRPHTLVFGCSDSRVAAEIIFDQGLGDLFMVRTAGHVVDTGVLGSVEFAVSVLQVPLVVVLGHDQCGAVAAAVQAVRTGIAPPGYIRDITERVTPAVLSAQLAHRPHNAASITAPIDDIEAEHVRSTARLLVEKSRILDEATRTGRCLVLGATYQLADGRVELITRGTNR